MAWADIEQILIDHLGPVLDAPVGVRGGTGKRFVKVFRTGGPRPTPVTDEPTVVVEAYDVRGSQALALLEQARESIAGLVGRTAGNASIKRVREFSGPASLPDPVYPDLVRYTYTVSIHLRAAGTPH